MELTQVILGPVVTEKSEQLKSANTHVIRVNPKATKVDVKNALKKFYGVDVASVRVLRTGPKYRMMRNGDFMMKRHRTKRVMVTLAKQSKSLDLATFKAS